MEIIIRTLKTNYSVIHLHTHTQHGGSKVLKNSVISFRATQNLKDELVNKYLLLISLALQLICQTDTDLVVKYDTFGLPNQITFRVF